MEEEAQSPYDVVILGGGVAALWTLRRLEAEGYRVALVCQGPLGGVQSLAAQGVIHGGLKYALKGKLTDSSEALAAMPERWASSLRGEGEIDLRKTEVLSDFQLLWSLPQVVSQVLTFFGGQVLQNRAQKIPRKDFPAPFDSSEYRGQLFRIGERVVDPVSLVRNLAEDSKADLGMISSQTRFRWESNEVGEVIRLELILEEGVTIPLKARHWLFVAGAGNEALLTGVGRTMPEMQVRPLHQVVLRSEQLPSLFSVCMGTTPKPPVVTTTHRDAAGKRLWYVGGDLAETGVERSEGDQIAFAQQRFRDLMPWIPWDA
ncbi:MAG: FAD-dependent oxidoreductase, partial [Verrucomicrobiota bacterium]